MFEPGIAAALHRAHQHPRLLLGPAELDQLKERTRSGAGRKLLAATRERVQPHVDAVLAADDVPAFLVQTGLYVNMQHMHALATHNLAMVGLLDNNEAAIEAAIRVITHLQQADELNRNSGSKNDLLVHGNIFRSIWAYDLLYDHIDAAERRRFTRWVVQDQVRRIIQEHGTHYFHSPGANLRFGKVLSAIHAVLTMAGEDGIDSLDQELDQLVRFFEAAIHAAVSSDGYPEEDVGYGTAFLALIFVAALALRRSGRFDAFASHPRLLQSGDALLHFVQPWGERLTNLGDANDNFELREAVLPMLAHETGNPALLWLLGNLTSPAEVALRRDMHVPASAVSLLMLPLLGKPETPARLRTPASFIDRRRGLVSFRSGWRAHDTYVSFDGSQRCPAAQGHAHASAGHFTLSALGEYFSVDTGRYNMEQDQHSVVLVDGVSGRSSEGKWIASFHDGVLTDYRPGRWCDIAKADSSHQHDCYWARRTFGLVKSDHAPSYVWMIDDLNKANDFRTYWWTMQTSPINYITLRQDGATIQGGRYGNLLDIHFAIPAASEYPRSHTLEMAQDVFTTGSPRYISNPQQRAAEYANPEDMLHYSVFQRPRLIAKVAGYNGRIMSLLLPRVKGSIQPRVQRLDSLESSIAMRVSWAQGIEDTIIWAFEHGLLEAGDIVARGDWCLVRRDANRRLIACDGGDLRRLEIAGKPVAPQTLRMAERQPHAARRRPSATAKV